MNNTSLGKLLLVAAFIPLTLYVAFDVFTSGGNSVGRLFMYLGVFGALYGALAPKRGFYFLLFLTLYLDFFKRTIIFDQGSISRMDLYYVLGVAPLCLAGIVAGTIYHQVAGSRNIPRVVTRLFVAFAIIVPVGFMATLSASGGFRAAGDAVNAVCYMFLIPLVPIHFPSAEDGRKLLRILVWLAVPSAVYMLIHFFRGAIFDWELDYVKSGLTIEIRQLAERSFRPFGTMNSAANASVVLSSIAAVIVCGAWRPGREHAGKFFYFLIPAFIVAAYATLSRMGWFIGVFAIMGGLMLRRRATTFLAYAVSFIAVIGLVLAAPWLLKTKLLNSISGDIYAMKGTDRWAQTTNISTLNDRLEGYYDLIKKPGAWTPFGQKLAGRNEKQVSAMFRSHDAFSGMLLKFGYVPLLVGGLAACAGMVSMHKLVFRNRSVLLKKDAAACLGLAIALVSGGVINGAQLLTYPTNFYIYFFFGLALSFALASPEDEIEQASPASLPGIADRRQRLSPVPALLRQ